MKKCGEQLNNAFINGWAWFSLDNSFPNNMMMIFSKKHMISSNLGTSRIRITAVMINDDNVIIHF